ncbi:MAG: UDP-2,3-diacylglucosamine diphosphatase LpxI [Candidatus Omnitrophota bacterium]
MERIGLIAGNRRFPLLFLEEASKRNVEVVTIGIKGDTDKQVKNRSSKFYWISVCEFPKIIEIFKKENIQKAVMSGQVNPRHLFNKKILESEFIKTLLASVKKRQADAIFSSVCDMLKNAGIELLDSRLYLQDHIPQKGILTKKSPILEEQEDIEFGKNAAKIIGEVDIGQTVCVKNKTVIAVEAIEGTDATIRRAGFISRGSFTVVKTAKPNQDMRFDIPVVGLGTIKNLIKAKVSCLAIEADKTLVLDKQACINLADKFNISIVAI